MSNPKKSIMKVKKEINEQCSWGIQKCRWAVTDAIIKACKETGCEPWVKIPFTQLLMLHTTRAVKHNGDFSHFETETVLADCISLVPERNFFMLGFAGKYVRSSNLISIDALCCVFAEMKNVLRKL